MADLFSEIDGPCHAPVTENDFPDDPDWQDQYEPDDPGVGDGYFDDVSHLPPIVPRPYQEDAAGTAFEALKTLDSCVVKMATGLGKTPTVGRFCQLVIAENPAARILILAHRDELIRAAVRTIRRMCPDAEVMVEKATRRAKLQSLYGGPVVVIASVATLCWSDRLKRFHPETFSHILVDEAHHAIPRCPTFWEILAYFKAKRLGVTATVDRGDEEALAQTFDDVVYDYPIDRAIDDGWIVPIVWMPVYVSGLDLSRLHRAKKDLNLGELERVMTEEGPLQKIITSTYEIANTGGQKRPTLLHTTRVSHAEVNARVFNRIARENGHPPYAAVVSAKTDPQIRRAALERFTAGEFQFMNGCGVFLEGVDLPCVRVVVPRMTLVRSLLEQMIGRGLRPLPGVVDGLATAAERKAAILASAKPSCLVIDYHDNGDRHDLVTVPDIFGGKYSGPARTLAVRDARAKAKASPLQYELKKAQEAVDEEQERRRREIIMKAEFEYEQFDPFKRLKIRKAKAPPRWASKKHPTENMIKVVQGQGIDTKGMSFYECLQIIRKMTRRRKQGLCSLKQMKLLTKYGYDGDSMSFEEAKATIDRIAANGWERPKEDSDLGGLGV